MTIEIIARKMAGGRLHEHIAEVKYINSDGETKKSSRQAMVDWLDKSDNNKAIVYSNDRTEKSWVGTVHPSNAPDYIRTYADGEWNDNLLALPEYF